MMGEARRRKAEDPFFGHFRRNGQGLVVCSPMKIEGQMLTLKHSLLDPQEIRFSLLFWDRLVWPQSNIIFISGGQDEEFLSSTGILERPEYTFEGNVAQGMLRTQMQAYLDLNSREPGLWALAQGENSLMVDMSFLLKGRGILVELHRAIPVPDKDVPLNDMLEFRQRRKDELESLRDNLGALYTELGKAGDWIFELNRQKKSIDKSCSELLKVAKEWKMPFRLSSLSASVSVNPIGVIAAGSIAFEATQDLLLSSAIAASASISINSGYGIRNTNAKSNPYRYVCRFHEELF